MMLPSSVRRVATTAPQSPLLSTFAPTSTRAPAGLAFTCSPRPSQRRRYSSSKPSSPSDSPKGIPDGQVATAPAQAKQRKRKAKDGIAAQSNLPSVPSTHHIPQNSLALSTFFSLHRPMSVHHTFPKIITDDAFAQIFAPRPKANKYSSVISTIANTVNRLEQPMQELNLSDLAETDSASMDANGERGHRISVKNPDGTESSVFVQLEHMAGQFSPFRSPPAPQAQPAAQFGASEASPFTQQQLDEEPQTRVYKAMFTLEETIDENGEARIVAHSPQIMEESDAAPRSFLGRMALRQIKREQVRGQAPDMQAISVKRQRKLKMKKKKYKKLMKRTRNERLKLNRM
ncbi:hypothetical protein F5Y15DRAFT_268878 [Xylariaceae sp. FL0016]|nr:hypothetical protein F5Y15DRAFT_268878 [Xylariaceae sp. FL0016]